MSTGILVLAALVVIIFATVALVLWRKVWVQQADNVLKLKDLADKKEAHQAYIKDSLRVICETLLRGEMNYSEGAIRLKVLLDNWEQPDRGLHFYSAIERLHDAVAHFDTHAHRQSLTKAERRAQDVSREEIETNQGDAFKADVKALLAHLKPPIH